MANNAPVLINCLRRDEDVFVEIDGKPRRLPRLPGPRVVHAGDATETLTVTVGDQDVDLEVLGSECSLTIRLPQPQDGVLYLVDDDVLLRNPARSDFVTPASYRVDTTEGTGFRSWLVAVHRRLDRVGTDTPNLDPEVH